ncbi:MAG TPA: LysM peptidoglycan-binding domain-containing protein, partial [Bacteroidales bacterium]|nr:LysM peptidoglycan-binding domain-containing protein [Bacteroidales bacterium]
MLRHFGFFVLILTLSLISPESKAQFEPAPITRSEVLEIIDGRPFYLHTVQPGQTLFGIARAYGVTIQQIADENQQFPDILNVIRIGMVLRIPAAGRNLVIRETLNILTFIEHEVARRETLFGLARRYNVSQEELLKYNPEARRGLSHRQILRIPVLQSALVEFFYYNLQIGETFASVANHFRVAPEELERINPGIEPQYLAVGDRLRIPARAAVITPPLPATAEPIMDYQILPGDERQDPYCLNPELKPHYNVALLIPLYLDHFDEVIAQNDPNHISFTFIQFYQGVMIALDSIRQQGVNIKLHTFDVGRDLESARRITSQPGFDRMDLIIGPFFPEVIPLVAEFGRRNNISVVSPFYDNTSLLKGFPNLFQVSTSLRTQLRLLAAYLSRTYYDKNIIIVHNNLPEAIPLINEFRNNLLNGLLAETRQNSKQNIGQLNDYLIEHGLLGFDQAGSILQSGPHTPALNGNRSVDQENQVSVREVIFRTGGMDSVRNNLDLKCQNILITLISGEAFLSNYLRELNLLAGTHQITLFGTSEWLDYQTISLRLFEPVRLHVFSNDFIEYRDKHIQDFVLRFRNTFNIEPDEGAMLGVQT